MVISRDVKKSFELTRRWNLVAVITDGTAVLGLGDIGPERECLLWKGNAYFFMSLAGLMLSLYVFVQKMLMRL